MATPKTKNTAAPAAAAAPASKIKPSLAMRLAAKADAITPEQKKSAAKIGAGVVVGGIIGALLAS